MLSQIVEHCDCTYITQIFNALYSVLCISNLVPYVVATFSPLKHLAREDVIFQHDKVVIIVKWSKTMQYNNQMKLITIPAITRSKLCPVSAISNLLCLTPRGANLPLFQVKNAGNWVPLTNSRVRRHFSLILDR